MAGVIPDVKIRDEKGQERFLRKELGERGLLVFGYFRCPHLCQFTSKTLAKRLSTCKHIPRVTFITLDHEETKEDARAFRKQLAGPLGNNWKLFTAEEKDIAALTKALNFSWKRDPASGTINHEAAVFVTQDGEFIRKLPSLDVKEGDLDLTKPQGKFFDFKQFCSAFDPARSKYGALVVNSLTALSAVFVAILGIFFWRLRRRPA
jgi:cytochrome oxidase Cu insertion factor (SCO1/SenC/PrrC family)